MSIEIHGKFLLGRLLLLPRGSTVILCAVYHDSTWSPEVLGCIFAVKPFQCLTTDVTRCDTLSEKIAHSSVYHHLSQLSVGIQLNGLIQIQLIQVISHSLGWISPGPTVLKQLTQVIYCSLDLNGSWVYSPVTSQKLRFSQLPTLAVMFTAQWAVSLFMPHWHLFWVCIILKAGIEISNNKQRFKKLPTTSINWKGFKVVHT